MSQSKSACLAWLAAICVPALPGIACAVDEKYNHDALG